ncbi:DUF2637 domain-containing protein [Actinoallomurus soli]|uniref:DUF2637 domain-containing protein n=1 Tax=Actinoallomurus soli TaxID=2952535 RepID=UPI002093447E|nr:DUF2637 domain-containing protein [Actinoallomurus soli]MCO5968261.1 DUF2637 domain-containing protein [Actinoallomurus soli]
MTTPPTNADRDWWVMAGMSVAAASAAIASFSGLQGLAHIAGWPSRLSWLLPVTLDAYAMTSARVWLAISTRSAAARRFARFNALGAIAASIAGNATYHAARTGLLSVSWPIVVLVGAVPAAVLGLTAHLHALQGRIEAAAEDRTGDRDRHSRRTRRKRHRRYRTEDELIHAARAADARHREVNDGRPITRDALRTTLRVSNARATELRRQLIEKGTADEQADL